MVRPGPVTGNDAQDRALSRRFACLGLGQLPVGRNLHARGTHLAAVNPEDLCGVTNGSHRELSWFTREVLHVQADRITLGNGGQRVGSAGGDEYSEDRRPNQQPFDVARSIDNPH